MYIWIPSCEIFSDSTVILQENIVSRDSFQESRADPKSELSVN